MDNNAKDNSSSTLNTSTITKKRPVKLMMVIFLNFSDEDCDLDVDIDDEIQVKNFVKRVLDKVDADAVPK